MERGVASPAGVAPLPREVQETRSSGQYDPCREQGRGTTPEGIPDNGEHGHGPQNRHGGAPRGERFLFRWEREAPQSGACVPVMARESRMPRTHPMRPSALPTPSIGVENEEISGARRREKGERRG